VQLHVLRFVCLSRVSGSPRWSGRLKEAAGSGSQGAASSESAADSVVSRSRGRPCARVRWWAWVGWDGCEVRLPLCPVCVPAPPVSLYRSRVSRVCPGSPGVFSQD
jgi:hypothetical protein